MNVINSFQENVTWKRRKTFGFLIFSGGIEMEHRLEMG